MRVSKEFLMEAVGLSLLVALILLSVQMFQKAEKIAVLLENEQEKQIMELEEYELTKYDGLFVDGITAVGYIKNIVGTYCIPVRVTTLSGEFSVREVSEYSDLRNMNSEHYIHPMALYLCEIFRDENGAVAEVGITVEKKGD